MDSATAFGQTNPARLSAGDVLLHRTAIVLSAAWTAVALAVALFARPVEYGCEYDAYHVMAERLVAGEWPRDVYRPPFYVLSTAALSFVFGSCFAAAKAISAMAAGATLYVVFRLGKACFSPSVGLVASLFFGLNPVVQQWAVSAASDALFTLMFTTCLWAVVVYQQAPSWRQAAVVGGTYALAWFTRYPAIALLPAIAFVMAGSFQRRPDWRHAGACAGAALVGLIPHMAISVAQFGKPFHDENWRNLALRHHGRENDWEYLYNNPFHSTWSVIAHDPGHVAENGLREFASIAESGLANMLFREVGEPWRLALLVLTGIGALCALVLRPRQSFVPALTAFAYVTLVSATFYGLNRILLPTLPQCCLALAFVFEVVGKAVARTGYARLGSVVRHSMTGALAFVVCLASGAQFLVFLRHQHHELVAVVGELGREATGSLRVLSNFVFLERHVPCVRESLNLDEDPEVVWSRVHEKMQQAEFDLVAISRMDQPWMCDRLLESPLPPFVELVKKTSDVQIYAIRRSRFDAIEGVVQGGGLSPGLASPGNGGFVDAVQVRYTVEGEDRVANVDSKRLLVGRDALEATAGDLQGKVGQKVPLVVDREDPQNPWVPLASSHSPEPVSEAAKGDTWKLGAMLIASVALALLFTAIAGRRGAHPA